MRNISETGLQITYSDQDTSADSVQDRWCRIVEDEPEIKLSIYNAASLVDEVYNRNPCSSELPISSETGESPTIESGFETVIMCGEERIRIVRSDVTIPYTPRVTEGITEIESIQTINRSILYYLDVENATEAKLLYPIVFHESIPLELRKVSLSWYGISGPRIKLQGTSLSWDSVVTGRMVLEYPTEYELCTFITDRRATGTQTTEDFTLTVFYNYNIFSSDCSIVLCTPSGASEATGTSGGSSGDGGGDDSEGGGDDSEGGGDDGDAEGDDWCLKEYSAGISPEELCCGSSPLAYRDCLKYKVGTVSPVGLTEELQDAYSGDSVTFVPVGPAPGENCGDIYVEAIINAPNCCDEAIPLKSTTEDLVIADYSSGFVYFTGGLPEKQVSVRGDGFYLDAQGTFRDGVVSGNYVRIYTQDACGACDVTITDGCTTITIIIKAADGRWVLKEYSWGGCLEGEYVLGKNRIGEGHVSISGNLKHGYETYTDGLLAFAEGGVYYTEAEAWANMPETSCGSHMNKVTFFCKDLYPCVYIPCTHEKYIYKIYSHNNIYVYVPQSRSFSPCRHSVGMLHEWKC